MDICSTILVGMRILFLRDIWSSYFTVSLFTMPETNLFKQPLAIRPIFASMRTVITEKAFIFGMILLSLIYSMIVMFNTVGPFIIQDALKYSVIAYGRIALLMGFGYFIGNVLNRQLISFFSTIKYRVCRNNWCILLSASNVVIGSFYQY